VAVTHEPTLVTVMRAVAMLTDKVQFIEATVTVRITVIVVACVVLVQLIRAPFAPDGTLTPMVRAGDGLSMVDAFIITQNTHWVYDVRSGRLGILMLHRTHVVHVSTIEVHLTPTIRGADEVRLAEVPDVIDPQVGGKLSLDSLPPYRTHEGREGTV
jgi:hypothetical protein